MELIDSSGEVIKYREIYSCYDLYSSSVIIPLKEPGYRLNITLMEGGTIERIYFELIKNDEDEWECQPYYTSSDINPALYGDIIFDTYNECYKKKEEYTGAGIDTEEEALQQQYEDKIKENEEKYDFPLVALCKISEYYIVEDGYKYCSCFIYNEAPFMELCGSGDSSTLVKVLDIFENEEQCLAAGKDNTECQEHEMGYTETRT